MYDSDRPRIARPGLAHPHLPHRRAFTPWTPVTVWLPVALRRRAGPCDRRGDHQHGQEPGVTRARLITTLRGRGHCPVRQDLARVDLLFSALRVAVFAADRPLALTRRSLIWRGRSMADTRREQKHPVRHRTGGTGTRLGLRAERRLGERPPWPRVSLSVMLMVDVTRDRPADRVQRDRPTGCHRRSSARSCPVQRPPRTATTRATRRAVCGMCGRSLDEPRAYL
jgi:hypothetical protein